MKDERALVELLHYNEARNERSLVEQIARRLGFFRMREWAVMTAGAREPYREQARTIIALVREHDRRKT